MISRKVLKHKGCTNERLREIFTSEGGKNHEIRKRFENRIRSRIMDGVTACAKNAPIWQAVDIAMDSTPIQKDTIPLLLYAQGKITKKTLVEQLQGTEIGKECIKVQGDEIKVDVPRLYEMSINLIRSYVTRRLASQTSRFSNLWPYFKFEPRGVDLVSKLRGDALSERMDVMVDTYNQRHFWPQTFRHQFMYSRSVVFARSAWDRTTSWRAKDLNLPTDQLEIESYVEREGLDPVAPHITRVFYDRSAPLANVNSDTGPSYIGYWDILRYGTILDGDYFNTKSVSVGSGFAELVGKYLPFFSYYFDPCILKWPDQNVDASANNDRTRFIGTYSSKERDQGCLVTQYYERINPKREGISELNVDVWVRLSVAGDDTVVGGEFLCSRPACYGGLNENDGREVNASMATDLMGFQDQLTNIFSQMLMNIRAGMLQIWAIDQDALDQDMKEFIKKTLKAKDYYSEPQAFFYSGEKLRATGISNPADNPKAFLTIIQAQIQTSIEVSLKAAVSVLNMADRILMMSPNETAQPNPREVAAREVTEISTSTDTIKTFVSDGIDEQRAAWKKLSYESLISESDQEFSVPVINRYTVKTIREAGFELKAGDWKDNEIVPLKTPIIGRAQNLIYDYYFDSRDGGDRPLNSQGAGVMGNLLGQFMQIPVIAKAFGKKRLFEWCNEIARMSGAPADLKLELDDNEPDVMAEDDSAALAERIAKLEQFVSQLMAKLGAPPGAPQANGAPPPPPPPPNGAPAEPAAANGEMPASLRSPA